METFQRECSPIQHVLYLRTHKTASSTLVNILFRYGDYRNLSFVLHANDPNLGWPKRFKISRALLLDGTRPNLLCGHTRYNKEPMNYLFPRETSKYITSIRNPVEQFESIFNYFGLGKYYGLGGDPKESLERFLEEETEFKHKFKHRTSRFAHNPMSFDLGLEDRFYQNITAIKEYIAFLEKEFDLVMISDYFDESVVLMKRLFCWEFEDILYIKANERIDKERAVNLSENAKENIKKWNKADVILYQHFNQTFWRKIQLEGEDFYNDLKTFRHKRAEITRLCLTNETSNQLSFPSFDKYAKVSHLKQNLSGETKEKCETMTRFELPYIQYLREKQHFKFEGNFPALPEKDDQRNLSWNVASELRYVPV